MYSSSSSSSANYSDSGYSEIQFPHNYDHHKEEKSTKRPPTVHSKQHSVRKIPGKDKIMKKPIAPWPRTPPKVYNVAPINFRDVVQKLTGAPDSQPTRLHEAATLPHVWFPLAEHTVNTPSSAEEGQQQSVETISFGELMSPNSLSMSPPSLSMDLYYLCP